MTRLPAAGRAVALSSARTERSTMASDGKSKEIEMHLDVVVAVQRRERAASPHSNPSTMRLLKGRSVW
ncbi:hypothetical protein PG994_009647 [Apiospora phragmitis]|uniref:Uncharacterized protein n=1 Tax=Apiospora phragmitis TaxID=2905665 RepID=A0ABR1U6T0_9PEZI